MDYLRLELRVLQATHEMGLESKQDWMPRARYISADLSWVA